MIDYEVQGTIEKRHRVPILMIEVERVKKLGRCYSETYYKVLSYDRVKRERIMELRKMGLLGYGQGFSIEKEIVMDASEVFGQEYVQIQNIGHSYRYYDPKVYITRCRSVLDSGD